MRRLRYNKRMNWRTLSEGFTLVELSLSMVFISTLSLTVVLVIAGAISSYHKSITLNQVNTIGTSLVDDMRYSIQESSPEKLEKMCSRVYGGSNSSALSECEKDGARRFVSVVGSGSITVRSNGRTMNGVPLFGAFCTGTYSYIWNSGYYFNPEYDVSIDRASLLYDTSKQPVRDFKLLKVLDENRAVCVAAVRVQNSNTLSTNYSDQSNMKPNFDLTKPGLIEGAGKIVISEDPVEQLSGGDDGMALYNLTSSVSEQSGLQKNMYYYTSFILGTVQGGVSIDATGGTCNVPENYNSLENFNYCAINKFNFAALANRRKK